MGANYCNKALRLMKIRICSVGLDLSGGRAHHCCITMHLTLTCGRIAKRINTIHLSMENQHENTTTVTSR